MTPRPPAPAGPAGVTLRRAGACFSGPPSRPFRTPSCKMRVSCPPPLGTRPFATAVPSPAPGLGQGQPAHCPRCLCKVLGRGAALLRGVPGARRGRGPQRRGTGLQPGPAASPPAQGAGPPPPMRLLFRSIRLRLIKNNRSLTLALLPPGWCVVNGDIVSLDPRLLFCLSAP